MKGECVPWEEILEHGVTFLGYGWEQDKILHSESGELMEFSTCGAQVSEYINEGDRFLDIKKPLGIWDMSGEIKD